jgi:hypothetical protein
MKEIFQKRVLPIGLILLFCLCVSYGISTFLPIAKALALLIPSSLIAYWFLVRDDDVNERQKEQQLLAEAIMEEQESVIIEYERIFDTQLVELPCICGGNTFQGLISPTLENIVECESCKNKYRVEVSYNSVLVSEPLDLNKTFEELVENQVN